MPTIKKDGYEIVYEDTKEIRDAVFERMIDFYKKHNCYCGESIQQMDEPIIDAPNVLSDIADDIIKFKYVEEYERIKKRNINESTYIT